ncbi:MAG: pilus assembly protein FimV, partial [Gammaproteobacteria bacterium]
MVRKKLAVVVAALGAFQTGMVSALGMGEFSLNSSLNQPLDAEIRLLNTRDLDKEQVRISLAKSADFKLSGVDRDFFLTNIKFVVELDGDGNGVVKLTTKEPVVEPFLNFLLETRWPTGRLLREYTVLLDLPVFSESGSQGISAALSQQSQSGGRDPDLVETSASVSTMSSARQASMDSELRPGETYRVESDDTLWKIAAKSRPSRDVSIQQTLVGIQRINPRAFMGGNINRLKAGSVLRLPTEDEIDGISGKSAVREVANQNRAWRAGDDSTPMTDVQLDATDQEESPDTNYEEQGRLSIATSGDSDEGDFIDGDGGQGGSETLRNELAVTEETLSKVERENGELKSRLDGMEDKIVTLQRLLELKDDQLTAMQSEFSQGESEEESLASTTEEPGLENETETALAPLVKPAAKAVPKSVMKKPEPTFFEKYISSPVYSGGAALLILIIAALVFIRRRKTDEEVMLVPVEELDDEPDDGILDELSLDQEIEPEATVIIHDDLETESEEDITDQLVADLEATIVSEKAESSVETDKTVASGAAGVQSEIGDVIAEVDIYIAYGRFQQAAELLTNAIAQEPNRSDLQMKLLQVYLETRDKLSFQKQYLSLYALGDENAIVEVKELLSTVDGVSDWLDDLPGESVSSDLDDLSLESDLSEADFDLDEELEIDLELDEDMDSTVILNPSISAQSEDSSDLEELDLDLDLDLDLESDFLSGDTAMQSGTVDLDEQRDDDFGELAM